MAPAAVRPVVQAKTAWSPPKQPGQKCKSDQRNRERIEKHKYWSRIIKNYVQSQVRDPKGKNGKSNSPETIGRPVWKQLYKCTPAACNQPYRRLQTRHCHSSRQNQRPGTAKIISCNTGKSCSSIFRHFKKSRDSELPSQLQEDRLPPSESN